MCLLIFLCIKNSYKSFDLNFLAEIKNGIIAHKISIEKEIDIPSMVPKKSLKMAPV